MKSKICIVSVALFFFLSIAVEAQEEKKKEMKIEVSKKIEGDESEINLVIKDENGEVLNKSYASEEEMRNDPDLEGYNVFIREGNSMLMGEDQVLDVIVESEHDTETDADVEKHVWIKKIHEGEGDQDFTMEFEEGEGHRYKIRKDDEGNTTIWKDGEEVNAEELGDARVKINKLEDGTIIIHDGDKTTEFKPGDEGEDVWFFADDEGEMTEIEHKDGNKMVIITKKDADGNVTMEMDGDSEWVHEEGHNEFITEDGDHVKVYVKKVGKVHIEILDLHEIAEFDEIPGVNLKSDNSLELDEVNFYPNPNEGAFTVKFKGKQRPTEIRIVDMMGKVVYLENLDDFGGLYDKEINLSGNDPGVYIMQINQGDQSLNKKIVIE